MVRRAGRKPRNYPMRIIPIRFVPHFRRWSVYLVLIGLSLFGSSCFTFNPKGSQSSLIILAVTLEKDEPFINEWVEPTFHKVTLFKGEKEISYSRQSGHYYYFQNLSPGQYEIGNVIHLLHKGTGGHGMGNADRPQTIELPFTIEDRLETIVDLEPGALVFMGEIQVKSNITVREPIDTIARFSKSLAAEKRALNHLVRNHSRSGWAALAKERLASLNILSVGEK